MIWVLVGGSKEEAQDTNTVLSSSIPAHAIPSEFVTNPERLILGSPALSVSVSLPFIAPNLLTETFINTSFHRGRSI